MPDTEKILAANRELASAIDKLSVKVDKLDKLKSNVRYIIFGCLVLSLLVAGIIVALVRVDHANNRTKRIQEYQVTSCESGNEFRTTIQNFLASLEPANPKKLTPQQQKKQAAFKAKANAAFAVRDCTKAVTK